MNSISLYALGHVTISDASSFLSWLDMSQLGQASLEEIERSLQIGRPEQGAMLTVLEQLGFVARNGQNISITAIGQEFHRSDLLTRKAMLRSCFLKIEAIQQITEQLKASRNGYLPRRAAIISFGLDYPSPLTMAAIEGFLAWAQLCDLLRYDKANGRIYQMPG